MEYRRLGRSGLKVSLLSFGSWVTFGDQLDAGLARECIAAAWEAGCTFFDNAEAYAGGRSEEIMGQAFEALGLDRDDLVVSTKLYWGLKDGPNRRNTLNRKYLLSALEGSLERMGLDYVDVVFCHRADPETPVEETVWARSDLIERGAALYWGTSEWPAADIRAAWEIAERHHLRKPVVEQPQYHLLHRERVEVEYARLYDDLGLGLTTWSPLGSGMLTGKYLDGIPDGTRGALAGYEWLRSSLTEPTAAAAVRAFVDTAARLGVRPAHLAIAWCAANPHVSTVITGASRPEQVGENFAALDALPLLTPELRAELDGISHGARA